MSTRTDWGWFKADGTPIAVGDAWHDWICPERKYVPMGYEHPWTGEWIDEGYHLEPGCRTNTLNAKCEECPKCGNRFIYP